MINLPICIENFTIKKEKDGTKIFDPIRKKWLVLTPEEMVRQNIIYHFIKEKQYPKSKIAVEKQIVVNGLIKRFDIVVFDKAMNPWMIIECKQPNVEISNETLHQLINYQSLLQAKFWVLSNGITNLCGEILENQESINWRTSFPTYNF